MTKQSKSEASRGQNAAIKGLIDDLMMQVKDHSEDVTPEQLALLMNGVMKVHYEMCEQYAVKIIDNGRKE